ncbi:hypothetical protein NDU88_000819 [Pleurodeles waltl]|uniref:Uncharacterized protein n=1 Tax=Pleurodeles waltl TaxID=8319 RepID=A0AAV7SXH4_PLEWA|nr:hypothetical protein NDU88_000819 [Pleurodeles waltl]
MSSSSSLCPFLPSSYLHFLFWEAGDASVGNSAASTVACQGGSVLASPVPHVLCCGSGEVNPEARWKLRPTQLSSIVPEPVLTLGLDAARVSAAACRKTPSLNPVRVNKFQKEAAGKLQRSFTSSTSVAPRSAGVRSGWGQVALSYASTISLW